MTIDLCIKLIDFGTATIFHYPGKVQGESFVSPHLWYSMFDLIFSRQVAVASFHTSHTSISHNARVRVSFPSA